MVATAPGEKLLRRPRTISSLFCAESNLVLRKINKNCCHAPELCCLTPICTKSFVGWGFATGFTGGVHSTPPGPLAVFRGPTSKGRGRQGEGGSSSFARGRKKKRRRLCTHPCYVFFGAHSRSFCDVKGWCICD